jgi:2',3'-cyclic-nucleotide 2'-phosphodiesterase
MKLLFFGDLVGKPGRNAVIAYLKQLKQDNHLPDIVIANIENATHGFGLSKTHYQDLAEAGVQVMTSGNHIWDRKDISEWMGEAECLFRPFNFSRKLPGKGYGVVTIGSYKLGVINAIGQVFMGHYNTPWDDIDDIVTLLKQETPMVFCDFHGEATAEKHTFAHYLSSLGVSAFVGTHTHVQTADEKILNGTMGFITDAGFNGAYNSIIGMDVKAAVDRLKNHAHARLEVPETSSVQINAVEFDLCTTTGACLSIKRHNSLLNLDDLA